MAHNPLTIQMAVEVLGVELVRVLANHRTVQILRYDFSPKQCDRAAIVALRSLADSIEQSGCDSSKILSAYKLAEQFHMEDTEHSHRG